jgi:CheY-like chemotaxis protein
MSDSVDVGSLTEANILIVEDENIIAKDIEQSLRQLGYGVCGAVGTGDEAVSAALELRPDLILMDIHLRGDVDGVEAARRISTQLAVPIVFLTAFAVVREPPIT